MNLDFVRIEYDITVTSPIPLATLFYDALRSFEAHFKAVCCTMACESCADCPKDAECPYRIVFAQQLSPDPEVVKSHQKPSLPFSLAVDVLHAHVACSTIGMTIVGSALNHVDVFHCALKRLIQLCLGVAGLSAPPISRTFTLDYQGNRQEISDDDFPSKSMILLSSRHILLNTVHSDQVTLLFKTPLRLTQNGMIMHHFDFAAFFRSQLRRCSSLYAYYGTGKLVLDYPGLSLAAQNIAVLEDEMQYTRPPCSLRHGKAGLMGRVECSGLVEPMFSLLLLGSYLNAGKGAAFGSGFYAIEVL